MPFRSIAQEKYFNANRGKLEKQGVDVDEWNSASKGMKLPAKAAQMNKRGVVSDKAMDKLKNMKAMEKTEKHGERQLPEKNDYEG